MTIFNPLISIITVTYNAEKVLEKTILSVISQTYPNIEFIIIDGNSKDKTLEIIQKYEKNISKWISEPDSGLYDAMNKGIQFSSGGYLWFINAGDTINKNNTLENIITNFREKDFYYGETMLVDATGNEIGIRSKMTSQKLPENISSRDMKTGMVVNHQSIIVKKEIAPFYNLKYRYSADIDWTINCLKKAKSIQNTYMIISRFMANPVFGKFHAGGASKKHLFISIKERFLISVHHFGFLHAIWYQILIAVKAVLYIIKKR